MYAPKHTLRNRLGGGVAVTNRQTVADYDGKLLLAVTFRCGYLRAQMRVCLAFSPFLRSAAVFTAAARGATDRQQGPLLLGLLRYSCCGRSCCWISCSLEGHTVH